MKYKTNCPSEKLFTIRELFEKTWADYLKSDFYKGMDECLLKVYKSLAFTVFLQEKGFSVELVN